MNQLYCLIKSSGVIAFTGECINQKSHAFNIASVFALSKSMSGGRIPVAASITFKSCEVLEDFFSFFCGRIFSP